MLLDKVEDTLALDLDVLEKRIPKTPRCSIPYTTNIGEIGVIDKDGYYFLNTNTSILINGYHFTTFKRQLLYNGEKSKPMPNQPFTISCPTGEIEIPFKNVINYLHLPDFVATYVINNGIPTKAVEPYTVLSFDENSVEIFYHNVRITTPYYLFYKDFSYTPKADLLAKIIGLFDAFKRGELTSITKSTMKHFIYPYVSLIVYKHTRSTVYPSFLSSSVNLVLEDLGDEIREVLEDYIEKKERKEENEKEEKRESTTLEKILHLIDYFNHDPTIIE